MFQKLLHKQHETNKGDKHPCPQMETTLNSNNQGVWTHTLNCTATRTGCFFHCYKQFIWKHYLFIS